MLFNSWEFIFFFIIICSAYFLIHYKYRPFLLLISSYSFYMYWRIDFAIIMFFITIVNFIFGLLINNANNRSIKKLFLLCTIFLSLLPLFYFKYFNFIISNINYFLQNTSYDKINLVELILPVGISFFTFQALSYSLDIYFSNTKVEKNIINFSVFVSFFPQLIAGPIEKSSNLLHQFKQKHDFCAFSFIEGIKLFIWGLFKKVVIADRLSGYVDRIYDNPDLFSGSTLLIATIFFAIQIYCDFSGYSDMAIGLAKILGFKLMKNFNLPYFAQSISGFWKRWHISLSSWFSDYLYKPLGGNRVSRTRWIINIFIVFIVSGFWHGANWTFIIWGMIHAIYYLFEIFYNRILKYNNLKQIKNKNWYNYVCTTIVFLSVCYAWIFFRAKSINDAFLISKKVLLGPYESFYFGPSSVTFTLSIFFILILLVVQLFQSKGNPQLYFFGQKTTLYFEILWYVFLLTTISALGISSNSFIYFQF